MIDLANLPNAQPDEKIVYFLRKHPITLLGLLLGYAGILILPIGALWYIRFFLPEIWMSPTILPLIILGGSLFFLYSWLFLFQAFIDYYLDIWIVTNYRILNIEQNGLFSRRVSELRLYRIQDATATITGFLHTMLNYGKIEIQTAGENIHFTFNDIAHPNEITKTILQLAEEDRRCQMDVAVEEFGVEKRRVPKKSPRE